MKFILEIDLPDRGQFTWKTIEGVLTLATSEIRARAHDEPGSYLSAGDNADRKIAGSLTNLYRWQVR